MNDSPAPSVPRLSICFSVLNRSAVPRPNQPPLNLFPRCLESVAKVLATLETDTEIVIVDWDSSDWPLPQWVPAVLGVLPYRIVPGHGKFHRGAGRNIAAHHARAEWLFFCDADMIVERVALDNGFRFLTQNQAYFAKFFYFLDDRHRQGFWCNGRGNCFLTRTMLERAGGWPCPPSYPHARHGDQRFYDNVLAAGIPTVVADEPGLLHRFHPGWSAHQILTEKRHLIREGPDDARA